MSKVIPIFTNDADRMQSARHLRDLADALERGDLQHVVVFSSDMVGRMSTWMSVLPRVQLAAVVGAIEIAKTELVSRALDMMYEAQEEADGGRHDAR